jgi:hypothetical protein
MPRAASVVFNIVVILVGKCKKTSKGCATKTFEQISALSSEPIAP